MRNLSLQKICYAKQWDGKGEIWDVKGNKSLRDAHEKLAKDFISWVESSKEPTTNIERVFAKLKELWNKIAAFLYQIGFQTHAGYFEMLYSGKLKASAEGINVEGIKTKEPNLALTQSFSPIWFSKLERVIEQKAPNKNINPTSLIAMLKNNGVKDEEIKW